MTEAKQLPIDSVVSYWHCTECLAEVGFTFADCAVAGTPMCSDCNEDMVLLRVELKPSAPHNYLFTLCFSMDLPYSPAELEADPDLFDVGQEQMKTAIFDRFTDLAANNELLEAVGPPEHGEAKL